jgi:hypothetical protein
LSCGNEQDASQSQHTVGLDGMESISAVQQHTARHIMAYHSISHALPLVGTLLLPSTAQRSTAQHSTAQHSTAQHSTAQHSTARHIISPARPLVGTQLPPRPPVGRTWAPLTPPLAGWQCRQQRDCQGPGCVQSAPAATQAHRTMKE